MFQRHTIITASIIAAHAILSGCTGNNNGAATNFGPASGEVFFSRADLTTVMPTSSNVTYLHCYYVRPDAAQDKGSVMVMGARSDHQEVHSASGGPLYRCFNSLSGDGTRCDLFLESTALQAVKRLDNAPVRSFAAVFSTQQVSEVLRVKDCNGVRLTSEKILVERDPFWTMRMTPVSIQSGQAKVLGDPSQQRLSMVPCPNFCGNTPAYFLNRR